jgi:hypothetical protein
VSLVKPPHKGRIRHCGTGDEWSLGEGFESRLQGLGVRRDSTVFTVRQATEKQA